MDEVGKPPIVILGGGGHASVLADICLQQGREIMAVVSPDVISARSVFRGIKRLERDTDVLSFAPKTVELVNGIGNIPGSDLRRQLARKFSELGYRFRNVIASSSLVSEFAVIDEGAQVLPGAIINSGAILGPHSIVNSGAVVEHDCVIEEYVHVGPNSTICGGACIGAGSIIGPSAVVAMGLNIGKMTIIGAGASVVRSVGNSKKLIPAHTRTENNKP